MREIKSTRNIAWFVIMGTFNWISLYSIVPQISKYSLTLGLSIGTIGLINSAYGISQTALRIPIGILSNKRNRQKIFVVIGLLLNIIGLLLAIAKPSFLTLYIMRMLAGVASATWVNQTALILSYYPDEEKSVAVSVNNFITKLGQMLAMLIGGYIVSKDIKNVFYLGILTGAISLISSLFLEDLKIEDDKKDVNNTRHDLFEILKNKNLMFCSIIACLIQTVIYATIFSITPIYASNIGMTNSQLAYNTLIFIIPQIFITILVGTHIKKYISEKKILLIGLIMISCGTLAMKYITDIKTLYFILFVKGIGNGMGFTILMDIALKEISIDKISLSMGIYQSIYGLGIIFGPIISGYVSEIFSIELSFTIIGIIGLISILFIKKINIGGNDE